MGFEIERMLVNAIVSDSGSAFVSADYEACCERLNIRVAHAHIEARQSWQNLIATRFNIQRLMVIRSSPGAMMKLS